MTATGCAASPARVRGWQALVVAALVAATVATPPLGAAAGTALPDAPTAVTSVPAWRPDAVDVSWTRPDTGGPITDYIVDVSTDGGAHWTRAGRTTTVRGTFPCGTGDAECVHRVTARNADGAGSPSEATDPVVIHTPQPPAPPASFTATYTWVPYYRTLPDGTKESYPFTYDQELDLTWIAGTGSQAGAPDHYVVQQCATFPCDNVYWTDLATTTATTYHVPADALDDGNYGNNTYRIVAVNADGTASSATLSPTGTNTPWATSP